MTPEDLDVFLRTPTEHEARYLKGWQNPDVLQQLEVVSFHGKKLKILRLRNNTPMLYGGKHSRFSAYPAHLHPWIEFNYMYSGSCTQMVNGAPVELKQGQMLLLNYNTIHEIPVLGENDILLNIYVRKEYLNVAFFNRFSQKSNVLQFLINSITQGLTQNNYLHFASEHSRRLAVYVQEFFCERYDPCACSEDVLSGLFGLILSELVTICETDLSTAPQTNLPSTVLSILKYLESHYQTASLQQTASSFGLNPDYLSRILKKYTGKSFQTLLLEQRLSAAKQLLLQSDLTIENVAHEVGYDNVTFFYKKFEAYYHCSPGDFRMNEA